MTTAIPASLLCARHLDHEVSIPLANGASVKDVVTEIMHCTLPKVGGEVQTWKREVVPMTLVRFKNIRPVWEFNRQVWNDVKLIEEFFQVDPTIIVAVED